MPQYALALALPGGRRKIWNMEHSGTSRNIKKIYNNYEKYVKLKKRNNQKKVIKVKITTKIINKPRFPAHYKCPFRFMFTGNSVR